MRRSLGVAGRWTVAIAVVLLAPAAASAANSSSSVVMFSDPGDWVGQGQQQLFDDRNGSVTISGNAGSVDVGVSGGTSGSDYDLNIAAPPGQTLQPGFYGNAQRAPFRTAGHPGIDILGDGRGCDEERAASPFMTFTRIRARTSTGCGCPMSSTARAACRLCSAKSATASPPTTHIRAWSPPRLAGRTATWAPRARPCPRRWWPPRP